MDVETVYEHSILKLKTGNYYSCWIICGDGSRYLHNEGKFNLVGQIILCLKTEVLFFGVITPFKLSS